ncbi:hypothetical protein Ancab_006902 [Ancistrocladus abbreviatus]
MYVQAIGICDAGIAMPFHTLNCPPIVVGSLNKNRPQNRRTPYPSYSVQLSSLVDIPPPESKNPTTFREKNTVGIIGGVSVLSTLIFLEKLVWRSSRDGKECVPFILCNDPSIKWQVQISSTSTKGKRYCPDNYRDFPIESLKRKREFLEKSEACCIVMPCHLSHVFHREISEGCSLPFFHVAECVAKVLKEANLKPIEAGSNVRIGVIAADADLVSGFYQEKLQSQGFEVVLPDEGTIEHIITPAMNALNRKDMEGARNLLRIAVQVLLVRSVNAVILASDELQGLLPHDDPLLKKCIDPMDALARSTTRWAQSISKKTLNGTP